MWSSECSTLRKIVPLLHFIHAVVAAIGAATVPHIFSPGPYKA